jgi:hypothetical protein
MIPKVILKGCNAMGWTQISGAMIVAASLAACSGSAMTSQSYPGRTQVQFLSADQVTTRTYACEPGSSEAQTQQRAARAHRYVDAALSSAYSRLSRASGGGFGASLGVQAEMNAETVEISRQANAEYRCVLVGSR